MARPGAVVVGTGFGCRVHVPALRAAGFDVVALVGRDPDRTSRRAERLAIPYALTSLDEALSRPGVEAVTIATPPSTHTELAITAARAHKHVLCEKPFAMSSAEAARMLRVAEEAGVTHIVGHEFRWASDRAVAGRAIAAGRIGVPRLAVLLHASSLVADSAARMPRWWFERDAGGGWLGAAGSHVIDQLRVWFGEFESLSAALNVVSDREAVATAEDSFTIRFRMRSGVDGVLQQTAGAWGRAFDASRVVGTLGTLWLDGGDAYVADAAGVEQLAVPHDLMLPPPPEPSDDARHRFTHLELGPFTRLCEVLRAGVDGRPLTAAVPIPTFADGVAAVRVLDAVRVSAARDGATVAVEPAYQLAP
jgi:predicted dehydrogenase